MRFLTTEKMLAMLPADRADELEALNRFSLAFGDGPHKERLTRMTEAGDLRTASFDLEGEPCAVIWYRVEGERLIVDTLMGIGKGRSTADAWGAIWDGVSQVGRAYGCNEVEGVTARAALARVYLSHGFEPRGVLMRKRI
jgi:hypothetical protein